MANPAPPAQAAGENAAPAAFTPLSTKDIAYFEKRLLEERKRVLKELGHHGETFGASLQDSAGELSSYSFHMADQGTDAMEREKAFLFASQEGRFLWHIDEALRRLADRRLVAGRRLAAMRIAPRDVRPKLAGAQAAKFIYNVTVASGSVLERGAAV